ncbi:uncharacterized protein LOC117791996 [Drosophila innubila]|uniref:uncharacterized protein LOC117791996 n=1 Tax=Drosophila innubila TaxID=198719 RepID=UPI00148DFE63|nr:uncharacterized protein LOC117791996 [Drosophila innubila]
MSEVPTNTPQEYAQPCDNDECILQEVVQERQDSENEGYNIITLSNVNHVDSPPVSSTTNTILKEVQSNSAMLKKLLEEVIHLRNEVQELKKNMNKNVEDPKSCLPKLPIDDMAELKNFDKVLQSDETMKSQLKTYIRNHGANDVPTFIRSALKAIFTDSLAVDLTWRDIGHAKFPMSTKEEMNKICQQHLVHAKDRIDKHLKKKKLPV